MLFSPTPGEDAAAVDLPATNLRHGSLVACLSVRYTDPIHSIDRYHRPLYVASLAGFLILAGCLPAAETETLTGKVVSIADGDTLTVLVEKVQHKIRVSDIDCPERRQPFGTKAKQFTGKLAFGKVVTDVLRGKDARHRTD